MFSGHARPPRVTLDRFWSAGLRAWPVALSAGLGALALYVATLSPFVDTNDPAEFQTLAASGGIAHAGYPAYVMLLELAGSVPVRTLAWRANLLTACFGAVAVALLAYTAYRWTGRRAAALGSAAVFATAITTWNESTLAGVHAPTLAVDGALLLLAMRYAWRPGLTLAFAAGLLFGLGVTGHLTVLALGPVLLLGFVLGARHASHPRRDASMALLAFMIGLLPFTYTIAVDRPEQPMNYVHDTLEPGETPFAVARPDLGQRVQRLVWLVSGEQYIGHDRRTPAVLAHRAAHVVSVLLLNDLPFVATLFAVAGFVLLLAGAGLARAFVLAWFVPALVLAGIGGTERTLHYFFQPCTWLLCVGLAVAFARLAERNARAGLVAIALVLAMPVLRHSLADPPGVLARSGMWKRIWSFSPREWSPFRSDLRYDAYGRGVMARLHADAVVLGGSWDECETLRYFVYGEPLRPDVSVLLTGLRAPRFRRMWAEAEAAGRPVYMTRQPEPAALEGGHAELVWDSGWRQLWRVERAAIPSTAAAGGR